MNISSKKLEYDSNKFGYEVADISISGNLSENVFIDFLNKITNIKLLYFFIEPEHVFNALLKKYKDSFLVDKKTVYRIDLSNIEKRFFILDKNIYSLPKESILSDEILELAYQSGLYSRFKIDKKFNNFEFEKLYYDWMLKSLKREIADDVLIYRDNNKIIGFITYSINIQERTSKIGLIAVDKNYRGFGIGKKLMYTYFYKIKDMCDIVDVVTQGDNFGACNFYEYFGFKITKITNVYHIWLNNDEIDTKGDY